MYDLRQPWTGERRYAFRGMNVSALRRSTRPEKNCSRGRLPGLNGACMRAGRTVALVVAVVSLAGGCKRRSAPAPAAAASARAAPPVPPVVPVAPDATLPADYDPTALVQDGADATKVYLAEPRRRAWADAVEDAVGGQLDRDVKH